MKLLALGLVLVAAVIVVRRLRSRGTPALARRARQLEIEDEMGRAADRPDAGAMARIRAGRIDAGQPIPQGWRW